MASWIVPLIPLFEAERAAGRAVTLATVLRTAGSTYRKAGALMVIAGDGRFAGLLSGGCLENDLAEHSRRVIETGVARTVSYDLRNPEDVLWGLGVGCEGAMDILLTRAGPANGWEPLSAFAAALAAHTPIAAAFIVESGPQGGMAAGAVAFSGAADHSPGFIGADGTRHQAPGVVADLLQRTRTSSHPQWLEDPRFRVFATPLALPPRERALLEALMLKQGSAVPKQALMDGLFELDDEAGVDALELYVHRLRKKLEASQARIITLRGVGYLLRVKEE